MQASRRNEKPARRNEKPARQSEKPARRSEKPARRNEKPARRNEKLGSSAVPLSPTIPYKARGINLISVALDAPRDTISTLAGKLGNLPGVSVKTAVAGI